jgi:hypothetical protein
VEHICKIQEKTFISVRAWYFLWKTTTQCSDVSQDWNRFLKHLNSFDLCVLPDTPSNSSRSVDEEQSDGFGNVSIAVTASLSLVQQLSSQPHNISTVTGFLPLGGIGLFPNC